MWLCSVAVGMASVGWVVGDDVCAGLARAEGVAARAVTVGVAMMTTSTAG